MHRRDDGRANRVAAAQQSTTASAARRPSSTLGAGGLLTEIQRAAGNRAAAAVVHQLQRYTHDTAPTAAPEYDTASGDDLPAFAVVATPTVEVRRDESDRWHGTVGAAHTEPGEVTLSWSDDQSIAMNPQGAKEFYATREVVDAANRSLTESGSYIRLVLGGHSLTNGRGERLTVVRPRIATAESEPIQAEFMRLVQHECVEVAEKITGGALNQAVFRGPDGKAVTSAIGPRGVSGLPRLAHALASKRPPGTPAEAASVTQGADPATAPGETYGTGLRNGTFAGSEQAIGLNEHARAQVGEALTTQSIGNEPAVGLPDNFDFSRNRVPAERIWVYHYAAVVAESGDGKDQVTLENFNRTSLKRRLAEEARLAARAHGAEPPAEAMRELDSSLTKSMGDMWYFKMYTPGGDQSFHAKNRSTAINPMTIATTSVPRLYFEDHSDVLRPLSVRALEKAAEGWRASTASLVVEGHARGGIVAPRDLAGKRADAVVAKLVGLGIPRERITVKTRSRSDRPFATVYPADRPEQYVPGSRS